MPASLKTSWTSDNPGRRFYGCILGRSGCTFFDWYDPPMCARAKVLIPGLLRKINGLEKQVEEMQREMQRKMQKEMRKEIQREMQMELEMQKEKLMEMHSEMLRKMQKSAETVASIAEFRFLIVTYLFPFFISTGGSEGESLARLDDEATGVVSLDCLLVMALNFSNLVALVLQVVSLDTNLGLEEPLSLPL
ncbi:hypothetical protein BUALT_Bualt08G0045900 [Buddleja alternifolia]|uniref:GRF-type domain-containing protein n=1 Tax=Buddleja alternifolia TaxID=168488 RepID=A0AAV6X331_9LAMI|nr:hypothetical protein BUALT_Bualt08G0045900 [Buddleja alternifolia]